MKDVNEVIEDSNFRLANWDDKHQESFLIAYAVSSEAPEHIIDEMEDDYRTGITKVDCPFGCGGRLKVCNPGVVKKRWTVTCDNDGCKDRTPLYFLEKMLSENWFDDGQDILSDEYYHDKDWRAAVAKLEPLTKKSKAKRKKVESLSLTPAEAKERVEAAGLNQKSRQTEFESFIEDLLKADADIVTESNVKDALVSATGLGIRKIDAIWNLARNAHRVEARSNGKIPVIGEWDDTEMVAYAEKKLSNAKDHNGDPVIYTFEGDYCVIKNNSREMLAFLPFKARLDDASKWEDKNGRKVLSPENVAKHCFYRDGKPGAELAGIKTTPYFDANWRRIDRHGYNSTTAIYLALGNLDVPRVSEKPTEEEVAEAKRLFVEEVFGDFPIGGLTREELVKTVLDGEPVPDFANLLGMVLQPFCRDGIDGPTPLYFLTKPTPGTGASLAVDISAKIATGDVAPPQPLPANAEELEKTMLAIAINGAAFCNFDNLNMTVSGGALASNLTARKVKGRLLSTSRIVEAPVRNLWVGTGNNVEASGEILRRIVMIEMDAHMARPETRSGWRHADIWKYVTYNRGLLVWAALTLIQNWVAKGQPEFAGPLLNSYENWSHVIGGILKAAGISGFLGNDARKLSYATAGADNNVQTLMQHLWDGYEDGQLFRAGGIAELRGYEGQTVESLKDVLNACGEEGGALIIHSWGYNKDADGYVSSNGVSKMFRKAARAPWEVEGGELYFEEHPDPKSPAQVFWIMRKRG